MAEPQKIWIDQCDATANIENNFGVQPALDWLIGEKFLDFLVATESEEDFRSEIPAFAARIKTIFKRWQMTQYLETGTEETEFSADEVEDIRRSTRDLVLLERAREWLLED